jgi:acetyl/propionyl-CoA carboxylase alpha subunit
VRVDAGVACGTRVSTFYDSMLAKVIGYGATRDDARRLLAGSLSRARLHGVTTNRDLLVAVLRDDEFAAGAIDTGYLDRHPYDELVPGLSAAARTVHPLAAALAAAAARRAAAPVLASLPSGFRNNPSAPQSVTYQRDGAPVEVTYRIGRDSVTATVAGEPVPEVTLLSAAPGPVGLAGGGAGRAGDVTRVDLVCGGVRRVVDVTRIGSVSYVDSALGHDALIEVERFPDPAAAVHAGSLLAPMPGTVVRIDVAAGDTVEAGTAMVTIEAMKMEHAVRAPARGTVTEVCVAVGAQVDSGTVLAVVEEEADE